GPTNEPLEPLSGGLRTCNLRVGDRRVLRIYAHDRAAAAKEATLLARGWHSFVVPPLLAAGDDFLVVGFVEHAPLSDAPEVGAVVGRALAEIHARSYPSAGWLAADLTLVKPIGNPIPGILEETFTNGDAARAALGGALVDRVLSFLDAHGDALADAAGAP